MITGFNPSDMYAVDHIIRTGFRLVPTKLRPLVGKNISEYTLYTIRYGNCWPRDASKKVRRGNYEQLFNMARTRVRAWERANLAVPGSPPSVPQRDGETVGHRLPVAGAVKND